MSCYALHVPVPITRRSCNGLNNVMVLHVYKDLTDELNLIDIGNEFVKGSAHRETVLGTFLATD